jgi:hypothetical protein
MIWHIFRKDVRLTWHLAAAAAGLHWTTIAIMTIIFNGFYALKPSPSAALRSGWYPWIWICQVRARPIPGVVRTGWCNPFADATRPGGFCSPDAVSRFLADLGACLLSGFSFPSLNAALQRSLVQMLVINLPFLAFASLRIFWMS